MNPKQLHKSIPIVLLAGMFFIQTSCQMDKPTLPSEVVYKTIDSVELTLQFNYPQDMEKGKEYPAIVFFFGGGFTRGTTDQFSPHARYFARLGMVGIRADYRVKTRHGTTPFESVRDAKSAVRYIRQHAKEFQIDPGKISASGGSAGGHLAAATSGCLHSSECKPEFSAGFNQVVQCG